MQHLRGARLAGLALAATALGPTTSEAAVVFSDSFNYAAGNLAGNNGGTGWGGGWTGGTSLVAGNLPGFAATSVGISKDASVTTRALGASHTTGGATSYYLSFLFKANPFPSTGGFGDYAGVSLIGAGSSFFAGVPGSSGQLGFDWASEAYGLFAGTSGASYLVLIEFLAGSEPGKTLVNLNVTTDFSITGSALAGGTAAASAEGANFTFGSVEIAGGYTNGSVNLAGLAMATSADEAVALSLAAVPEPSSAGWLAAGLLVAAGAIRHRNRTKPAR